MVVKEIVGAHRIEIETGGYVKFDVQLTNSPHRHDYYEICLALEGSGEYWHGTESHPIRPGAIFVAEPKVIHEIASFRTKDLHLYFLMMNLQRIEGPLSADANPTLKAFDHHHNIIVYECEKLAHYIPLFDQAEPHRQASARAALKLFALEMIQALSPAPTVDLEQELRDDLAAALEVVDRHSDRRITVEEIAAELGISARTLRRRFAASGTSLAAEINHRRMRWAAHRLLMGFTVQEVADYIGIPSAAQFTRSFTRAFGMGPKKFQTSYLPGSLAHRTRPERDALD